MRIVDSNMSNKSVFIIMNTLYQTEITFYSYLKNVDFEEWIDDFDRMQSSVVPLYSFIELFKRIKNYITYPDDLHYSYENDISITMVKLKNYKNLSKNAEDWKDYEKNYLKGFINFDKMDRIALQRMEENARELWSKAVQSIEESDSKILRLWKGLLDSDEGFNLICRCLNIDKNVLSDEEWTSIEKDSLIFNSSVLGSGYRNKMNWDKIRMINRSLLCVPKRIAKDEEDLYELNKFARTIVFGLLGRAKYKENEYVLRPNKEFITDSNHDSRWR